MNNAYQTEQEEFWAGDFGNEYIERTRDAHFTRVRIGIFARILTHLPKVDSAIEFGANIGHNLRALKILLPQAKLSAIEINDTAVGYLEKLQLEQIYHQSIFEFRPDVPRDLAMICGVMIHLHPEKLPEVYDKLHAASSRYILIDEYYNPSPVEVDYRGHRGKLFKRDFAGEMLDRFPDLSLLAYQFVYHRDPHFPSDDSTWFLFEKRTSGTTQVDG